jgi:hypothetical protein
VGGEWGMKKVKVGHCGHHSLYMYNEDGTLEPIKVILQSGEEYEENNSGDDPNYVTLYTYMEMHNETPYANIIY